MTAGFTVDDVVAVSKVLFLVFGCGLFASMKDVAPLSSRCRLEDLEANVEKRACERKHREQRKG